MSENMVEIRCDLMWLQGFRVGASRCEFDCKVLARLALWSPSRYDHAVGYGGET